MNEKWQDRDWAQEYDRQLIHVAKGIGFFCNPDNDVDLDSMREIAMVRADREIARRIPDGSEVYQPITDEYNMYLHFQKFFYIEKSGDYFFSKFADENLAKLWHDHQPKNFYKLAVKMGFWTPGKPKEWVAWHDQIAACLKIDGNYIPDCDCINCQAIETLAGYCTELDSGEAQDILDDYNEFLKDYDLMNEYDKLAALGASVLP